MVIAGDYNIPDAIWGNDSLDLTVQCPFNSPVNVLYECFSFNNFYQIQINLLVHTKSCTWH